MGCSDELLRWLILHVAQQNSRAVACSENTRKNARIYQTTKMHKNARIKIRENATDDAYNRLPIRAPWKY